MSDMSDLKVSVLEQAHEKGRLLLAEATEKIEQEAKEREAQLVRQKQTPLLVSLLQDRSFEI